MLAVDHLAPRTREDAPLSSLTREGLVFGCDYNPEQWDRDVWDEDMRLMREAGVGLVAVNIFGWSWVNPDRGVWTFDELDEVMDLAHAHGIRVNLGTATASPAPWVTARHPEILPVTEDGTRRFPGGRQAYCPSSPIFRGYAAELSRRVVERYADHPALAMWHVSNELGCHNALCYCDASAVAFRAWLEARYGSLAALNAAWGTSFWSQRYSAWEQILPPMAALSLRNPGQLLDFQRFSSDQQLELYRAEAAVIRARSSAPVTTNFMVTAHIRALDYFSWAGEMDVIANDHYLDRRLPDPLAELSFAADLTRGLAAGTPWLLMETSTGAVNWQPHNLAKGQGELLRNVVSHVARGADGICFFQWRASAQGAEKFHSALLPHAGTDTAQWRSVIELGQTLRALQPVAGSTVVSDAAVLFDWESWWALENEGRPSEDVRYLDQVHAAHAALAAAGVSTDVVSAGADLSAYRLVVVPALHLVRDADAERIARFVETGGTAVITFASGIVDERDRVRLGGYPGAFRDLLGIVSEEFAPLGPAQTVALDDGTTGSIWSERLRAVDAEVDARFVDGPAAGLPARTRRRVGAGTAWYLATLPSAEAYRDLLSTAAEAAGIRPIPARPGVEVVRRADAERAFTFVVNHTTEAVEIAAHGRDAITGEPVEGVVAVAGGAVRIIEETL
ncbi:beta-galactosidase [Microbacterium sp. HMWF026]|uniref:beta-galactosidase n=1 Tax=Microbacterium sp. HMWF026 TaxID=2056861 RepID=UPI000D39DB8E|nr:beta-galactosidase [Microbacterium sp. HMWF026]PTT23086.1 beta-galactosidase [Microbacterium sp. HMWF026]